MMLQNELKLSKILLCDIIERTKFNQYSLYDPTESTDAGKLKRFNSNTMQLFDFIQGTDKNEDFDPKVVWFVKPEHIDTAQLEKQVLKRLQNEEVDKDFEKILTQQQVDDIITCAASTFVRQEYSYGFKYVDLAKGENYIAFQSGVLCLYPPPVGFLVDKDPKITFKTYSARAQSFFNKTYHADAVVNVKNNEEDYRNLQNEFIEHNKDFSFPVCPPWFDARCRDWYVD